MPGSYFQFLLLAPTTFIFDNFDRSFDEGEEAARMIEEQGESDSKLYHENHECFSADKAAP